MKMDEPASGFISSRKRSESPKQSNVPQKQYSQQDSEQDDEENEEMSEEYSENSQPVDGENSQDDQNESESEEGPPAPDPNRIKVDLRSLIDKTKGQGIKPQDGMIKPEKAERQEEHKAKFNKEVSKRMISAHLAANRIADKKKTFIKKRQEESEDEDDEQKTEPARQNAGWQKKINDEPDIIEIPHSPPPPKITDKEPKPGKVIGKCMTMCTLKEAKERESRYSLGVFEIDPEKYDPKKPQTKSNMIEVKPEWAIKQFVRSAADREMNVENEIRPPKVLVDTMNYILDNIVDVDKNNIKGFVDPRNSDWETEIYKFVSDRARAIRQDFNIQKAELTKSYIDTFEKMARFHLMCTNHFIGLEGFDYKLNSEHFTETLTWLRQAYEQVRRKVQRAKIKGKQINSNDIYESPNEAEFQAYAILWQATDLLQLNQFFAAMPKDLIKSRDMDMLKKIISAYNTGNYVKIFKMLTEIPYLLACASMNLVREIRKELIFNMINASNGSAYKTTLKELSSLLAFNDEDEAHEFCEVLEVLQDEPTEDGKIVLQVSKNKGSTKYNPHVTLPITQCDLIEKKMRKTTRAEIIRGKPIMKRKIVSTAEPSKPKEIIPPKPTQISIPQIAKPKLETPKNQIKPIVHEEIKQIPFIKNKSENLIPPKITEKAQPINVPEKQIYYEEPKFEPTIKKQLIKISEDKELLRLLAERKIKRKVEKKKHSELCMKLLRFTMWRNYVRIKKLVKANQRRLDKTKINENSQSYYGITYGLHKDLLNYEKIGQNIEKMKDIEKFEAINWQTQIMENKLQKIYDHNICNKKEFWLKIAICLDLSYVELTKI